MYVVRYLHQKMHSIHHGIELDNGLVKELAKEFPTVYLCDFSLAKTRGPRRGDTVVVGCSLDYSAFEIMLRNGKMRYNGMTANILWCGVCLYTMIYAQYPKPYLHKKVEDHVYEFELNGIGIQLPKHRPVG